MNFWTDAGFIRAIVLSALLPLALNGCYTPFKSARNADSATLVVHNATDRKFSMSVYADPTECTGRERLVPLLVGGERRTIFLPSHGEVAMSVGQDLGMNLRELIGCVNALSFTPQPGATYFLELGALPTAACSMSLSEMTSQQNPTRIPTQFFHRKYTAPFTDSGTYCTKR